MRSMLTLVRKDHAGLILIAVIAGVALLAQALQFFGDAGQVRSAPSTPLYTPRQVEDTSGISLVTERMPPWKPDASLAEIAAQWKGTGYRQANEAERALAGPGTTDEQRISLL